MKKCTKCLRSLKLHDFHIRKSSKDGHNSRCKECNCMDAKSWRINNKEKCNIASKRWYRNNIAKARGIRSAWQGRNKEKVNKYTKKYREQNPLRYKAHWMVRNAILKRELKIGTCEVCGLKAEAHHPDYTKPLYVIWLCSQHHKDWHKHHKVIG